MVQHLRSAFVFFILVSLGALVLAVSRKDQTFSLIGKAATNSTLLFPKDHAAHPEYQAEWWYLNLSLRTENKDLAYVTSFSRIKGVQGLLTSRYDNSNKSFKQQIYYPGNLSALLNGQNLLTLAFDKDSQTSMRLEEQSPDAGGRKHMRLFGKSQELGEIDLLLKERTVKPGGNTPLLWGCTGNISVFAPDDTYYYSMPDWDITGTIKDIDGATRTVKVGKAWLDHQWFNNAPPPDWLGHYWASVHYSASSNPYANVPHEALGMVAQVYRGSGPKYSYWVKRDSQGNNSCGQTVNWQVNNWGTQGFAKQVIARVPEINWSGDFRVLSDTQVINITLPERSFSALEGVATMTGENVTGIGFVESGIKLPSCFVTGPRCLEVGKTGMFTGNFSSNQGELAGQIYRDVSVPTNDPNFSSNNSKVFCAVTSDGVCKSWGSFTFSDLLKKQGTHQWTWTPTSADIGTHALYCRTWDDSRSECRPEGHVDGAPRFSCLSNTGPGGESYKMTVEVKQTCRPIGIR